MLRKVTVGGKSAFFAATGRLTAALLFAGATAAVVVLLGTFDLESYEHVFVSLDRGTDIAAVRVQGHPVYTMALGVGVRLPLQGSVAGSPTVRSAAFVAGPLTYWLLLTLSITVAALITRHALEPLCDAVVSWLATFVLFWSVPIVNYAIYDDWIETTVTYCAVVACVFAPHALLALLDPRRPPAERRIGGAALAAALFSLIAISHAGHWPILAATLVGTSVVALVRSEYSLRLRVIVLSALAIVALVAILPQVPDILRELNLTRAATGPTELWRSSEGGDGGLLRANLVPPAPGDSRQPFTHLLLALLSLAVAISPIGAALHPLILSSACVSLALGVAAATLPSGNSAI